MVIELIDSSEEVKAKINCYKPIINAQNQNRENARKVDLWIARSSNLFTS